MGRKPEMKVSKAFTIGLQEAGFLAEKSNKLGMKASQYINWLLRQEMLEERQREPVKPEANCRTCERRRTFDYKDEHWLCDVCGEDRTDYVNALIDYGSRVKKR
jgi:ribosomal protein L37AE/L43A